MQDNQELRNAIVALIAEEAKDMTVLVQAKDAVYVRLPRSLWRSAGECRCPTCRGAEGFWDTLVVPTRPGKAYKDSHTYTVHMPDASTRGFMDYMQTHGLLAR